MDPQAPPPWMMFLLMLALVGGFCLIVVVFGGLSRVARGESFWPHDDSGLRPARTGVRSAAFRRRLGRSNGVQQRSARSNAEKPSVQSVQTFTERSNVQPPASDLPLTLDELQRLAHTIALYAKRPNKEVAIFEAWGETKGEGEGYKRASLLFDAAMSDAARQAAKAKVPQMETA